MALDFALPKLLWLPFPFTFAEIGLQLALFLRPLQHSLLPSLSGAVENSSVCMWQRRGQGLHVYIYMYRYIPKNQFQSKKC